MQKLHLLLWKVGIDRNFHIIHNIPWNLSSFGYEMSISRFDN